MVCWFPPHDSCISRWGIANKFSRRLGGWSQDHTLITTALSLEAEREGAWRVLWHQASTRDCTPG